MNGDTVLLNNDILIKSLRSAIEHGRVAHAYIFDGERGIGKTTAAKAFAKALNCEEGGTTPCGKCFSCRTFESGNNPDIFYIEDESGIKVDTVREKISREVMTKPYSCRYKVFIIKDAHKMNARAQNAFLKTLEEPPPYAAFLLLSQNLDALLATVQSRCMLFRLKPLPQPMLETHLLNLGIERSEAEVLSHYACGIVGRAIELHNDDNFKALSEEAMQLCLKMKGFDLIEMNRTAEKLKDRKDEIKTLLELMYFIFRDALVYKLTQREEKLIHTARADDIKKLSAQYTAKRLMTACEAVENAWRRISANTDARFVFEEFFYKMITAKELLAR